MEPQKLISLTESLLKEISNNKNNIREYYLTKIKHRKIKTQINYLICLKNLFNITGKTSENLLEKEDILKIWESEWYNSLAESSKIIYLFRFKDSNPLKNGNIKI